VRGSRSSNEIDRGHLYLARRPCNQDIRVDATSSPAFEGAVSYESTAEPIKVGYLFDLKLPADYPHQKRGELIRPALAQAADGHRGHPLRGPFLNQTSVPG
jgi:hypothetical protein